MSWLAAAAGVCGALAVQILCENARGRVGRGGWSRQWSQRRQIAVRLALAILILLGSPAIAFVITAALATDGAAVGAAFADFILGFVILEFLLEVSPAMTGRIRDADFRRWGGEADDGGGVGAPQLPD